MGIQRRQFICLLGAAGGFLGLTRGSTISGLFGGNYFEVNDSQGKVLVLKYKNLSGKPVDFEWINYEKVEELYNSYLADGRLIHSQVIEKADATEFVLTFKSGKDLKDYFNQLCSHSSRVHRKVVGVDLSVNVI